MLDCTVSNTAAPGGAPPADGGGGVAQELVVRVGPHKRTMLLPPALAGYRPSGATFEEDALVIRFDAPAEALASDA